MSKKLYIFLFVIAIHAMQFFLLEVFQIPKEKKIPHKMNIVTKSEVSSQIVETKQAEPLPLSPKYEPPKSQPKKIVKKVAKPKAKQLLKKIDQNLAKSKLPPKKKTKPQPVKKVEPPPPHLLSEVDDDYYEELCKLFENTLILPEKGMVKLTISVQANGKIDKIKLISSKSEKNLEYLENKLRELVLPVSRDGKNVAFTITFCDE